MPASLTTIDETAFEGLGEVSIQAEQGTPAYTWAQSHGYIYPESAHDYLPDTDASWHYAYPGSAEALSVTFSRETNVRDDVLTITDVAGRAFSYRGHVLAGFTMILPGDSFDLRLLSNASEESYGFSIVGIHAVPYSEYETYAATPFFTRTLSDGSIEITGYKGAETDVVIPDAIGGAAVTSIGEDAFSAWRYLTSVYIPASVTTIRNDAFYLWGEPPLTVRAERGSYAYRWAVVNGLISDASDDLIVVPEISCGQLVEENGVSLWKYVTGAGRSLDFQVQAVAQWFCETDADWLKPDNFQAGSSAAAHDPDDRYFTLYLSENTTGAARTATATFSCNGTQVIYKVMQVPFLRVTMVSPVPAPEQNLIFDHVEDLTFEYTTVEGGTDYRFYYCPYSYAEHTDYPVTVSGGLARVTIPAIDLEPGQLCHEVRMTVTDAYGNQYSSETVRFSVTDSAYTDWGYRLNTAGSTVTAVITDYYGTAESVATPLTIHDYPVTELDNYAFMRCNTLKSVTISEGVTRLGSEVFNSSENLVSVRFPESLREIGSGLYRGCASLTEYALPSGITRIDYGTFADCASLTSVVLPDTVTTIEDFAFGNCVRLASIHIPDGVTRIEWGAFSGCASLVISSLPRGVTTIPSSCFYGCEAITQFEIPDTVTFIDDYAFSGCRSMTAIRIPDSVTEIESNAFEDCASLVISGLPVGVTSIPSECFSGCAAIASFVLPNTVESIGSGAFMNCTGMSSIYIPATVTDIEYGAFNNCPALTIHGENGSAAQTYAQQYNIPFVAD